MTAGSTPPPGATGAPLLGEPLAVELMNTVWADRAGVHDALATPLEGRAWLAAVAGRVELPGLDVAGWTMSASSDEIDGTVTGLRSLRDAARALAARRTSDPRSIGRSDLDDSAAIARVNAMAADATQTPRLEWPTGAAPGVRFEVPARSGDLVLAHLAREVITLIGDQGGDALRACLAPGCVLYFVRQHPRREWCSDACGNRVRQARHYQRTRGQ